MYRENVARLGALVFLGALGFLGAGLGFTGVSAGPSPVAGSRPALLTPTPTCTPSWGIVPGPNTTHAIDDLRAVAAIAPNDVWAVGDFRVTLQENQALTFHWNGDSWTDVPRPNPAGSALADVVAVSSNNVWAVGYAGGRPFVLRWNGANWGEVPAAIPPTNSEFRGIAVASANDIWAVGSVNVSTGWDRNTLIERWDGSVWSIIPSPNPPNPYSALADVAVVSANDVWAVGSSGVMNGGQPLIEHWDGSVWSIVPSPSIGTNAALVSVAAVSANDVWAVGSYTEGSGWRGFTMHWDGAQWSLVPNPNPGVTSTYLNSITAVSAQEVWAVGQYYSTNGRSNTLTLRWNGSAWSVVPSPSVTSNNNLLYGVDANPAGEVWAVGFHVPTESGPLILRYGDPCTIPTATPTWTRTSTPTTPTATPTPKPPDCIPWELIASPNMTTTPVPSESFLQSVAAVSSNDVWAVGYHGFDDPWGCCYDTLIEHWNGATWEIVPSPDLRDYSNHRLLGVAALGANDVWAVGFAGISGPGSITLIEHWNGSEWSIVPSPNTNGRVNRLYAISALSTTDIWAVGNSTDDQTPYRTLVLHWDGIEWSIVPSPNIEGDQNYLTAVAAVSANDVWAVGYISRYRTLIMHWDGVQWSIVSGPDIAGQLNGVEVLSATEAWAVGFSYEANISPLLLRWDGTQWTRVALPDLRNGGILNAITARSSNDIWAVGSIYVPSPDPSWPLTMHWNGTNWSVLPAPNALTNLAGVTTISPTEAWAVGIRGTRGSRRTGTTRYRESICCTIEFSDVLPYDYFYNAVRHLFCMGALSGYADGTFRPYNFTTRAQLSKIVVLAEAWPINTTGGPHFSDVPTSNPFYPYIETAYNRGIISGYADGTFRPGDNVIRGQLCKIIVLAEGWPLINPPNPTFLDVPQSSTFYRHIETAYSHAVISGYSDGTFGPGYPATRGQIAKIVHIALTVP